MKVMQEESPDRLIDPRIAKAAVATALDLNEDVRHARLLEVRVQCHRLCEWNQPIAISMDEQNWWI